MHPKSQQKKKKKKNIANSSTDTKEHFMCYFTYVTPDNLLSCHSKIKQSKKSLADEALQ